MYIMYVHYVCTCIQLCMIHTNKHNIEVVVTAYTCILYIIILMEDTN